MKPRLEGITERVNGTDSEGILHRPNSCGNASLAKRRYKAASREGTALSSLSRQCRGQRFNDAFRDVPRRYIGDRVVRVCVARPLAASDRARGVLRERLGDEHETQVWSMRADGRRVKQRDDLLGRRASTHRRRSSWHHHPT